MCQCDWEHLLKNQAADCTERKRYIKKAPKLEKSSGDLGGDWDVVNSLG